MSRPTRRRTSALAEPLEPRTLLAASPVPTLVGVLGNPATLADFHDGVATDADGNYYVAGSFEKTIDLNPDPDKEFTLASSFGGAGHDLFLAKYNSAGNLLYAKQFSAHGDFGSGGVWDGELAVTPDGTAYFAFPFAGRLDADPGTATFSLNTAYKETNPQIELAVVRINFDGSFGTANKLSTPDQGMTMTGIGLDAGGRVYIAAESFVPFAGGTYVADYDTILYSLSANLRQRYTIRWGSKGHATEAHGIAVNPDGSVYLAGETWTGQDFHPGKRKTRKIPDGFDHRGPYLLRVNPRGQFDWVMGLEGPDYTVPNFNALAPDGQGGVYLTGEYSTGFDFNPARRRRFIPTAYNDNYVDGFIARYAPNGSFVDFWSLGQAGDLYHPTSLARDPNTGNLAVTGSLETQSWYTDPTGGQRLMQQGDSPAAFYATYTATGDLLDIRAVAGTGYAGGRSLLPAFAPDDSLYLLGHYFTDSLLTYTPGQPDTTIPLPLRGIYLLKTE